MFRKTFAERPRRSRRRGGRSVRKSVFSRRSVRGRQTERALEPQQTGLRVHLDLELADLLARLAQAGLRGERNGFETTSEKPYPFFFRPRGENPRSQMCFERRRNVRVFLYHAPGARVAAAPPPPASRGASRRRYRLAPRRSPRPPRAGARPPGLAAAADTRGGCGQARWGRRGSSAACVGRERNRTHLRVVLREFLVHDHEAPERGLLRRGLRRRGGFRRARARVPRRVAHGARASVVSRRTPPASRGRGRPKNRSTQRAPDYVEEERGVQARGVFRGSHASEVARDHGERVRQAHARLGALARGCFRVAGTKEETRFKISSRRNEKREHFSSRVLRARHGAGRARAAAPARADRCARP